jgi:Uncharacterized protein conserved in bacteria (DUF2252)
MRRPAMLGELAVWYERVDGDSLTALARAHARSGDRIAIAAHLGGTGTFDHAFTDFALAYADRTATDHAGFGAAVVAGILTAAPGV